MSDRISNGIPYLYREVPNRKVVAFNLRSVLLTPVVPGHYRMRKPGTKMIRGSLPV